MDSNSALLKSQGRITSLSAATTLSIPDGADVLTLQPKTQNVVLTLDGSTPSSTVGMELTAGTPYVVDVGVGYTVRVIEKTASASLEYLFEQRLRDTNA